jgi:hypothetical protein
LPGATTFARVTRESVLGAGEALGLPRRIGERELDRLVRALPGALETLVREINTENAEYPQPVRTYLGGEARMVAAIQHVVVPYMLERVRG